jgi:hypothetical protein
MKGDPNLVIVAPNAVSYTEPVDDPFYSAHRSQYIPLLSKPVYTSDNFLNVMGCVEDYQICNPMLFNCTKFLGITELSYTIETLDMNVDQQATALRVLWAFSKSALWQTMQPLRENSLLAQESLGTTLLSQGLPPDQWLIEVESWFKTSLASIQATTVSFAAKPRVKPPGARYIYNASDVHTDKEEALVEALQRQVSHQMVTAKPGYQSSCFGAIIIIVVIFGLVFGIQIGLNLLPDRISAVEDMESPLKGMKDAYMLGGSHRDPNDWETSSYRWFRGFAVSIPVLNSDENVLPLSYLRERSAPQASMDGSGDVADQSNLPSSVNQPRPSGVPEPQLSAFSASQAPLPVSSPQQSAQQDTSTVSLLHQDPIQPSSTSRPRDRRGSAP